MLGIPALELLFEFRVGFTPEERQVLGHLHRSVARRERMNANVVDASLGSDLRVSVRSVYNSCFFEPQRHLPRFRNCESVASIAPLKIAHQQSCFGYLRWSCCLSFG
jgi:hypothetical protein